MQSKLEFMIDSSRRAKRTRIQNEGCSIMRVHLVLLILITTAAVLIVNSGLHTLSPKTNAQNTKQVLCATTEHHQFDFWIGDWDTFDLTDPSKVIARNRVTSILDGCALREVYEQGDGLTGESLSIYDSSRRLWHQSWVTNRGQLLVLEGGIKDGRMTLIGNDRAADGKPLLLRGMWTPTHDGVRETAEVSGDGGKSWKPHFDIMFRPHARPATVEQAPNPEERND
jgi:hypothetical protein